MASPQLPNQDAAQADQAAAEAPCRKPVAGVRFEPGGDLVYFGLGSVPARPGARVVARLDRTVDLGEVVCVLALPEREALGLPTLLRLATEQDLAQHRIMQQKQAEALRICESKIQLHGLPMRLLGAHYTLDGRRLTFYFAAEGRVDFRALVRDLARTFGCRIELRQIGVRDQARLLGGLGPCGRPLCCASFLRKFASVSIRLAKDQGLALNPVKLSGLCDRLMCCLLYEHETYVELSRTLPKVGEQVSTPEGLARVESVNVLAQRVLLSFADGRQRTVSAAELAQWSGGPGPAPQTPLAPQSPAGAEAAATASTPEVSPQPPTPPNAERPAHGAAQAERSPPPADAPAFGPRPGPLGRGPSTTEVQQE
jgi:cell fate regulator YaaT (PSP1 superfamily)